MSNHTPHPDRIEDIRRWHIDQAVSETQPVAMFNVTITADNLIVTSGLGLDPVHAQILLMELDRVREKISSQLAEESKPKLQLVRAGCTADPAKMRARRSRAKVARLRLVG
jgi:hypothetical protein